MQMSETIYISSVYADSQDYTEIGTFELEPMIVLDTRASCWQKVQAVVEMLRWDSDMR